jgi:quinol monooxygenase YgiN
MVFANIRLSPARRNRAKLLEILRSVRRLTIVRPGCLGCWLDEEDALHNPIRYGEQWASEDDLYEHIRSRLYRQILTAIELSRQPPDVTFHYVSNSKGMELIEAVRSRPESTSGLDK